MCSKKVLLGMLMLVALWASSAFGLIYWDVDYNDLPVPRCNRPQAECAVALNYPTAHWWPGATAIDSGFAVTAKHWIGVYDFVGKGLRGIGDERFESNEFIIVDRRSSGSYDLDILRVRKVKDPSQPIPPGYDLIGDPDELFEDPAFEHWASLYDRNDEVGQVLSLFSFQCPHIRDVNTRIVSPIDASGTLRWGRNLAYNSGAPNVGFSFDLPGSEDYVELEADGQFGDSGSGWFLKDGFDWKFAGLFKGTQTGPRISYYREWIDAQIRDMLGNPNYVRPLPDLADKHWVGPDNNDWSDMSNWQEQMVPGPCDIVGIDNDTTALISSGQAQCDTLHLGIDTGANLMQSDGILTIGSDMYVGGRRGCAESTYRIQGGELVTKNLTIGIRGPGVLDIDSNTAEITTRNFVIEPNSILEAVPGSRVRLLVVPDLESYEGDSYFDIAPGTEANNLEGLGNLSLVCEFNDTEVPNDVLLALEVAGRDTESPETNDFNISNFIFGGLILGCDANEINATAGRLVFDLVDFVDNQVDGFEQAEAIYVDTLQLRAGVAFADINPYSRINLYYRNNGAPKRLLVGDLNLDGFADQADINTWAANEGTSGASWPQGDVNGDRIVDADDFFLIEQSYKAPTNPSPGYGDTLPLGTTVMLTWQAGPGAVSHDVYIGTDYDTVMNADTSSPEYKGNVQDTMFLINDDSLIYENTHYWRIDEVDAGDHVVKGYMWRFFHAGHPRVQNLRTGAWYNKIMQAINDSQDADTIVADQSTYYESVRSGTAQPRRITIRSHDPNDWGVVAATIIDGSQESGQGGSVLWASAGLSAMLSGFTLTDPGATGISCMGNVIMSNCIVRSSETGVWCNKYLGISPLVRNCKITDNSAFGIDVSPGTSSIIQNNVITACTSAGINIGQDAVPVIRNNAIVGNGYGVWKSAQDTPVIIQNCVLWDNLADLLGNVTARYSCTEDIDTEPTNIHTYPNFADVNNFRIGPNSPCIDAGDPDGDYTGQTDIDGYPRVSNHRVDIGACEYDLTADGHWWEFDECEGSTASDSVDNDDGTLVGDADWTTGVFGCAVTLDGAGDYVSVSSLDEEYDSGDTFSVAGWFKTSQSTGIQTIVGQWAQNKPHPYAPNLYYGWQVLVQNKKVVARFGYGPYNPGNITGSSDVNDGEWHHFALVYPTSGANAVLYVDGESEGTPISKPISSVYTKFRIGDGSYVVQGSPSMKGGPFNGDIDDVMLFEGALTAEEIESLYKAGVYKAIALSSESWWELDECDGSTASDSVGDANGALVGDADWTTGVFGCAVTLDGAGDYVSVASLDGAYGSNDTFSVAGWFKTSKDTGKQTVVGQWMQMKYYHPPTGYVTKYNGWQVLVGGDDVKARFSNGDESVIDIAGPIDINDGWHHFALVYDTSTDVTLYVDGTAYAGTESYEMVAGVFRIGDGSFVYTGSPVKKGGPFNGDIDDVMLFESALSASEVELLYEAGL